jgi:hypothetical protein
MRPHLGTLVPVLILVSTPASALAAPLSTDRGPQTAEAGLATRIPEGARFTVRDVDGTVLYRLTPPLTWQLRRTVGALDTALVAAARRLRQRRFTAAAYVQAVEDAARHGTLTARCIEGAAVWRVVDLPWTRLGRFCSSGRPLAEHLAADRRGARRMQIAGNVLSGIGAVILTVGLGMFLSSVASDAACRARCNPNAEDGCLECGGGGFVLAIISYIPLSVGGALLLPGIPLAVAGRRRREALDRGIEVLSRGTPAALRAFLRHRDLEALAADGPSLSLGAGPSRSAGVSLQLRF